jgi:hypothetical protein
MDPAANPFSLLSLIVAPAVLTNASSVLILSTSNRLARTVDRTRVLTSLLQGPESQSGALAALELSELRRAQRRMVMLIQALRSFYVALGGLASTALLSGVGAVMATEEAPMPTRAIGILALGSGFVGVGMLVRGASLLVRETRLAVAGLQEQAAEISAQVEAVQSQSRPS